MKLPVQVTFRNMVSSEIVERWIRTKAEKLETFYGRPITCRVEVRVPHRHHRKGSPYHIGIELTLPGRKIVVNRIPSLSARLRQSRGLVLTKQLESGREHKNLHVAINDTFEAAARQLRDYARRQRGDLKTHALRPDTTQSEWHGRR
jgi:ribosome-associated translation inhibitor RaiA